MTELEAELEKAILTYRECLARKEPARKAEDDPLLSAHRAFMVEQRSMTAEDYRYFIRRVLDASLRIIDGVKASSFLFPCPGCPRGFATAIGLRNHRRRHRL